MGRWVREGPPHSYSQLPHFMPRLQVNKVNSVFGKMEGMIDSAPAVHRTPAELAAELAALRIERAELDRVARVLEAEVAARRAAWTAHAATAPGLQAAPPRGVAAATWAPK